MGSQGCGMASILKKGTIFLLHYIIIITKTQSIRTRSS